MKIEIRNRNKINNSIIGNQNQYETVEKNKSNSIIVEVIVGIIIGVAVAGIVYWLGWN